MVQMVMFDVWRIVQGAAQDIYDRTSTGGRADATARRFFCGDKLHGGCEARLGPARRGTDAKKFEACHAHAFVALERGRGLGDGVLGQCSGWETDFRARVRQDNGHGGDGLRGHDVAGPGVAVGHGERVLARRGAGRGRRRRECDREGAPVGGGKVHVLDGRGARRARGARGGRGGEDGLRLLAGAVEAAVVGVRAQKVVGARWLWTEARGEGGAGVYFNFWLGVDAAGVAGIWQRGGEDVWRGLARRGGVRAVHVGLGVGVQPVAFYMCAPYMGVIQARSPMPLSPIWQLRPPGPLYCLSCSCPAVSPPPTQRPLLPIPGCSQCTEAAGASPKSRQRSGLRGPQWPTQNQLLWQASPCMAWLLAVISISRHEVA